MITYEMVAEADKNGKTYIAGSMRYQKDKGFHDDLGKKWPVNAFDSLNHFIHLDRWKEVKPKELTVKEIEKILGYEITIIVD